MLSPWHWCFPVLHATLAHHSFKHYCFNLHNCVVRCRTNVFIFLCWTSTLVEVSYEFGSVCLSVCKISKLACQFFLIFYIRLGIGKVSKTSRPIKMKDSLNGNISQTSWGVMFDFCMWLDRLEEVKCTFEFGF